jgi:TP901 family phage tail tape measure protein
VKIRDIYVEVRVRAEKALNDLRLLDRITKSTAKGLAEVGKAAGDMGKRVEAGAKTAARGLASVGQASKDAGSALGSLGGLASTAFRAVGGAVVDAVQKSIDFETSMAEISKVVGGLKTPTGEATAEFDKMKESIFDLSKEIAIAPKGFADIIAAAGQADIAKEELRDFAEDAAKMAVAFDIGADEAGEAMAKMRTGLGLSQDEVMSLAGTMNHLSNNMASAADELVDVTKRVGAMGASAGLTGEQVAAIGSAMISSGAKTNVAATGIKNFTLAMAAGEAATLRQRTAYEAIGLEAEDVATRFAKGGAETEGAIMDVLKRLKGLDEAKRASTIMQLFGRESMGAIAPLVTQIDNMGKAFDFASDKAAAAGSVQGEFDVRSKTTANAIQLLKNRVEVAAIQIGDSLLPALNGVLELLDSPEAKAISDMFVGLFREVGTRLPALFEEIRDKIGPVIMAIPELVSTAMAKVGPILESAIGIAQGFIGGFAGSFDELFAAVGPVLGKIADLVMQVLKALGLAGDEGAAFGEKMGADVGGTATAAIEAFSTALDGVIAAVTTLSPIINAVATLIKSVLGAAIGFITSEIDFLRGQFQNLMDIFREFSSGNFAEGFAALGRMILDSLLEPIRIVARALVDLADGIPGGSTMVPAVLREFSGRTAMGGVMKGVKGAVAKAGSQAAAQEAAAAETPIGPSRASLQVGVKPKPKAEGGSAGAADGEGGEEGAGGGGGGGRKGKKTKKEKDNLLDKAVKEAIDNKRNMVLGGTDRMAQQAGPAVTNIYTTFNMDIDARGNEGAAANVERGARRGASAGIDKMRGLGTASMRAKAGGGAAAGAG